METKIEQAHKLVVKDLNIEKQGLVFSSFEKLEAWLAGEISLLIDQDFQRLMNILYRIDVSEQKTKMAFIQSNPAREIAKLIIERELQKIVSREKYKYPSFSKRIRLPHHGRCVQQHLRTRGW